MCQQLKVRCLKVALSSLFTDPEWQHHWYTWHLCPLLSPGYIAAVGFILLASAWGRYKLGYIRWHKHLSSLSNPSQASWPFCLYLQNKRNFISQNKVVFVGVVNILCSTPVLCASRKLFQGLRFPDLRGCEVLVWSVSFLDTHALSL